jgi:ABC-type nickel/cobalt efflux system permease component RcnA
MFLAVFDIEIDVVPQHRHSDHLRQMGWNIHPSSHNKPKDNRHDTQQACESKHIFDAKQTVHDSSRLVNLFKLIAQFLSKVNVED